MNDTPNTVSLPLLAAEARENLTPFAAMTESPWVGGDLSVMPAASAFGVLARLVRLNALKPKDLFASFGLRLRRADDLSEVMTFSHARQAALAKALRLPDAPPEWALSTWLPFRTGSELLRDPWKFRYCQMCLATGYHTLLHQLPWLDHCPWHHCVLRTQCPLCAAPTTVRVEWLVDANLRCKSCDHDLLVTERAMVGSVEAPNGAQTFLEEYLAWAKERRAKTILLVPDKPSGSHAALSKLVKTQMIEMRSRRRFDSAKREPQYAHKPLALDALESFRRLDVLHQDRPGFLQVPRMMCNALAAVASNLALKLPPRTLTGREMRLFLVGMGIEEPKGFQPADRRQSQSVAMLPPTNVAGQQYLNLTCVHPSAYRAASRLVDVALNNSLAMGFHGQVSPHEAHVVLLACQQILCRGYAEGLRAILSRDIPQLYSMPRDRPHLGQPWMIATIENGNLSATHVVWCPIDCGKLGEADVLDQADAANRRRQITSVRLNNRRHL
ncbi:hypothetical protein [Dyella solisilvae]|uniref:hypothetical protein n=1 Tax=Dyella solisilvae TaxID=1920168 RepID=UPI0011C05505|nr:hypothetical protein [Dyella solisilvae]